MATTTHWNGWRLLMVASLMIAGFLTTLLLNAEEKGILIGVVTLSEVPAETETSGSVVMDPQNYADIPGLRVMTIEIPALEGQVIDNNKTSTSAAMLEGVIVDMGDGRKQRADQPITWIPRFGSEVVSLFVRDNARPIARGTIPIEKTITPPPANSIRSEPSLAEALPPAFAMPPIATEGGVQIIHGDTVGNSNDMAVTVDGTPAKIVAAKPGTVLWKLPETARAGAHEVTLIPGSGKASVKLPMSVLGLKMNADRTHLVRGESTQFTVTVTGLDRLPPSAWQAGLPPAELVDLRRWEKNSGAAAPQASSPGTVVVILNNGSPETVRMGKRGDRLQLQLHRADFAGGPYVYKDKLQSLASGPFAIHANVTAFLKEITVNPQTTSR